MFHVHNCIFEGINYHNLQHDIISTDRELPFLPSLCNTEVNEISSFKGGAVIAIKRSIRVVRALEVSTQIFLHIYVTVHLQFLRMLSDSKRARMEKKTERRENRSTNTVMQGCGKIFKKNNGLRMNQAWIANRVKQKKNEQTKQLPRKLEITFASFYSSNFFSGGV